MLFNMASPFGVACLALPVLLSAISYNGASSQPLSLAEGKGAIQDFSQYADRWTRSRSGCTCQFDFTRQDCACCIVGGAQCPLGAHNLCVKCGQEYTCGIPHPVIKGRVVNGWTGAMECPCPAAAKNAGSPDRDACACCINGGCPCASDPYRCTECGTTAGCGDGKNNPAGPPYVLSIDSGRSRKGYGIHVQRDPALPNTLPLGVGSGRIPDGQMSASSYIDEHMGPYRARLNALPSDAGEGGWSALELNRDQHLQIDMVFPTVVTGLATQGRAGHSADAWVTSYNLAHSMDGNNWKFYGGDREGGQNGKGMLFKGNSDCDEIVHHNLEDPIKARYVRFLPQDYYNRIGMRVELYGQEPEVPTSSAGIQNLALYKPARQSSTFEPIFGASGAVDGKDDEGVVITKVQTQPWWSVDLQDHHQIYFVAINNPGIMLCAEPKILTNFVVRVGDNPDVNNNPPCTAIYRRKVQPGESVQIQCQSIDGIPPVGRYVSIELNPDKPDELTHLQVSEVKVYGVATSVPGPTCQIKEGVHYLGMESGEINGAQISASKYLKGYQPQNARLNLPNRAWVAECRPHTPALTKERKYHLKIDLLALTDLEGLLTQGSLLPDESYVSQFEIETSVDGEVFVPYRAVDGTVEVFQSNMDGTDIVCHLLPSQICVRAIKIIPISWHHCVAMRVELLGYRVQHMEPVETRPAVQPTVGDVVTNEGVDVGKQATTIEPPNPVETEPAVEPAVPEVATTGSEPRLDLSKAQTTVVPVVDSKPATLEPVEPNVEVAATKPSAYVPIQTSAPTAAPVAATLNVKAGTEMPEDRLTTPVANNDKSKPVEEPISPPAKIVASTTPVANLGADEGASKGKPAADKPENKSSKKGKDKGKGSPKNKGKKGSEEEEPSVEEPTPATVIASTTPDANLGADEGASKGKPAADKPENKSPKKGKDKGKDSPKNKEKKGSNEEEPSVEEPTPAIVIASTTPDANLGADEGASKGKPAADKPENESPKKGKDKGKDSPKNKGKKGSNEEEPSVEEPTPAIVIASTTPDANLGADEGASKGKPAADKPENKSSKKGKDKGKGSPKNKGKKGSEEEEPSVEEPTSATVIESTTPDANLGADEGASNGKPAADKPENESPKKGKDKGKDSPKNKGKKGSEEEEPSVEEQTPATVIASTTPDANLGADEGASKGKPAADKPENESPKKGKDKGKDSPKNKGKKGSEEEEPSVEEPNPATVPSPVATTAEPVASTTPQAEDQHPEILDSVIDSVQTSSFKPGFNPTSGDGSWVAAVEDDKQYLDITFDDPVEVNDLIVAPVLTDDGEAMVTALEVQYQPVGSMKFIPVVRSDGRQLFTFNDTEKGPDGKLIFKMPFAIRTQRLRLLPRKWTGQIGMKIVVQGRVPEPQTFTLGSFVTNVRSSSYVPGFNLDSGKGTWLAADSDTKQFLQISFDSPKEIKKVQVAPVRLEKGKVAMVMKFKVFYRPEKENTFTLYEFPNGKDVFNVEDKIVRVNDKGRVTFKLRKPIMAKDLRIVPLTWKDQIGFKLNLLGRKPRRKPQRDGKPQKDKAKPKKAPKLLRPGRLSFAPSSVYKDYNPTTSSTSLWVPNPNDTKPYLKVTFDREVILTSIQARGRKIPELGGEGWIKEFRLKLTDGSKDRSWGNFTLEDGTDILAFDPVVDGAGKMASFNFPEDMNVSKLKFYPVSWEKFAAIRLQFWGYYKEKKRRPKGRGRLTLYYLLWKTDASWEDAQDYCSKDGGQLAKITDASVQDMVVKSIVDSGFKADWWIGITDKKVERAWLYSDDTSLDYRNWIGGGKPAADDAKNCAFLEHSEDYLWNDEDCNAKKSFICQYDKKPKRDQGPGKSLDMQVTPIFNFYSTRFTWEEAFDACKAAKGALVRIHSEERQRFLEEFFSKNLNVNGQFWIDASYRVKHKKIDNWVYSNGAKLDYNNGLTDKINRKGKQCAHFGTKTEPKFQWTSGGCRQKKGFICEIFPDKEGKGVGQPSRDESSYQVSLDVKKGLKTWEESKSSCESWGGHLLRIPDAVFQGLIEDTLDGMATKPEDTFWIDAHFDSKKMQYINSNNQKVDHSNFAQGFPVGGCAYLVKSEDEWKWEDGDCNARRRSICARATRNTKPTKPAKPSRDDTQLQLPATFLQYYEGYMYTWQEAAEYCSKEGDGSGHLLRISDQAMFNEVVKAVKGSAVNFWLDVNDLMSEGNFVYSDDSPLSYANWYEVDSGEKQPDGGKTENCVYMSYSDDFEWHDGKCIDRMSFICAFTKKPVIKGPPRIPEGAVIESTQPAVTAEPSTTPVPDINAIVTYNGSSADPGHGPDSKTGWIAALPDPDPYVICDFHQFVLVDELILRGVNVPGYMARITKFRLWYQRSPDAPWRPYLQFDGTSEFDNVVTDPDERATFLFDPPILGSLIKFQPIKWKNAIAARFAFNGRISAAPMDISDKVKYKTSSAVRKFKPDSKYGWMAGKSDNRHYLIADFGQNVELYRVEIEKVIVGGRGGWIEALRMEYSSDKGSWLPYTLGPADKNGVIDVIYGDSEVAKIRNSVPIVARYVKILPIKWHEVIAGKFKFFGYRYKGLKFRALGPQDEKLPASDQETTASEVEDEETGLAYNLEDFIDSYNVSASTKGFDPGSPRGWLSPVASPSQFLTVVFRDPVRLRRLKLKGIKLENYSAWVKRFRLLYKTKEDEDWTVYTYDKDEDEFEVPKDASPDRMTTFKLPSPIRAKYVKFQPVEWERAIGAKLYFYGNRRLGRYARLRERRTLRLHYSFHEKQASWSQATAFCQANGGSLVRVFAPRVQEAIVDQIEASKIEGDWWIDASDASVEDQWATSVGPLPYADWLSGRKPDSDDNKNCGFLIYAENYHWDHADCEETKRYICQYERKPAKKPVGARFASIRLFSYRLFSGRLAWVEAQTACRERGACLVKIPDPAVQNFLQKSMKTKGRTWLDVTYNVAFPKTNAWLCSAGIPTAYNNGLPKEIEGRSCAIARGKNFSWSSEECEEKNSYICQQHPTSQEEPSADDTQSPQEITGAKKQSFQIVRTTGGFSWQDAKKYCNDRGAHLLRVQGQEEQNRVVSFLETNNLKDEFWLDARVSRTGGKCMKGNGREVKFNKFQVKNGRSRRRQGCVYLSMEDGWSWKFSSCSDKKNFICQADGDERLTTPKEPQSDMIPTPQIKPVSVYYQFFRGDLYASSWAESNQYCRKAGGGSGHLARIRDQETMDYIIKMLGRGKAGKSLIGNFWFDASDVLTEGKYVDSNGETLDYTNWFSVGDLQEPSGGTAENCAFISTEHGFKWHDEACDHTLDGLICQFNTRPKVKPRLPQRDFERVTALRADLSFPKGRYTWRAGASHCKRKYPANGGGHLMRFLDDEQEAQIVSGLFEQDKLGDFYLDARLRPDGTWQDSNDVVLPFTNWLDGEPSQDGDNTCAILKLKKGGSYSWGANNCKEALPLICVNYVSGPNADLQGKRIRLKNKNRSSSSGSGKAKRVKSRLGGGVKKQKGSSSNSGKGKRVKSRPASDDLKSVGVKKQKGSHSGSGKAKRVKSRLGGGVKKQKGSSSNSGKGKRVKSRPASDDLKSDGVKKQKGSHSGSGKAKRVKSRLGGGVKKQKGSSSNSGKGKRVKSRPASDDLKSVGVKKQKGSHSGSGKAKRVKSRLGGGVKKQKGSSSNSGKGKRVKSRPASDDLTSVGVKKQKGSHSTSGKTKRVKSRLGDGVKKQKGSSSSSGKGKRVKSRPASDNLKSVGVKKQKGSHSGSGKAKRVKSRLGGGVKKQKGSSSNSGKGKRVKSRPASDDLKSVGVKKQKGSHSGSGKAKRVKSRLGGGVKKQKGSSSNSGKGKRVKSRPASDDLKSVGVKKQKGSHSGSGKAKRVKSRLGGGVKKQKGSSSNSGKGKRVKSRPASDDLKSVGVKKQKGSNSGSGKAKRVKSRLGGGVKKQKGSSSNSGKGKRVKSRPASDDLKSVGVKKQKGSHSGSGKVKRVKSRLGGGVKKQKGSSSNSGKGKRVKSRPASDDLKSVGVKKQKGSHSGSGKAKRVKSRLGDGVKKQKGSSSSSGKGKRVKSRPASDDLKSDGVKKQKGSHSGSGKAKRVKSRLGGGVKKQKGSSSNSGKGKRVKSRPASDDLKSVGVKKQKGSHSGSGKVKRVKSRLGGGVKKQKGSSSNSGKGKRVKSRPASDDLKSVGVKKQKDSHSGSGKAKRVKSRLGGGVKKQKGSHSGSGKAKRVKSRLGGGVKKQKGSSSNSGKGKRVKSRPASDDLKSVGVKKQKGSNSGSGKAKRVKSRLGGGVKKQKGSSSNSGKGKRVKSRPASDDLKSVGVKKQKGSNSGSGKAKRVKSRLGGGVKKQKGSSSNSGKGKRVKSRPASDDLKSVGVKKQKDSHSGSGKAKRVKSRLGGGVKKQKGSSSNSGKGKRVKSRPASDDLKSDGVKKQKGSHSGSGKAKRVKSRLGGGVKKQKGSSSNSGKGKRVKSRPASDDLKSVGVKKQKGSHSGSGKAKRVKSRLGGGVKKQKGFHSGSGKAKRVKSRLGGGVKKQKGSSSGSGKDKKVKSRPASDDLKSVGVKKQKGSHSGSGKEKRVKSRLGGGVKKQKGSHSGSGKDKKVKSRPASDDLKSVGVKKQKGSHSGSGKAKRVKSRLGGGVKKQKGSSSNSGKGKRVKSRPASDDLESVGVKKQKGSSSGSGKAKRVKSRLGGGVKKQKGSHSGSGKAKRVKSRLGGEVKKQKGSSSNSGKGKRVKSRPASDDLKSVGVKKQKGSSSGSGKAKRVKSRLGGGVKKQKGSSSNSGKGKRVKSRPASDDFKSVGVKKQKGSHSGSGKAKRVKSRLGGGVKKQKGSSSGSGKGKRVKSRPTSDDLKSVGVKKQKGSSSNSGKGKRVKSRPASDDLKSVGVKKQKGSSSGSGKAKRVKSRLGGGVKKQKGSSSNSGKGKRVKSRPASDDFKSVGVKKQKGSHSGSGKAKRVKSRLGGGVKKQKGSSSGSGKGKRVKSRPTFDDLKSVGVKKQKGSHSGNGKAKRVKSRLGGGIKKQKGSSSNSGKGKRVKSRPASDDLKSVGVKKQKGSHSGSGKVKRVKSRLGGGVKKQKGSSSNSGKAKRVKSRPASDDLKSVGVKKQKGSHSGSGKAKRVKSRLGGGVKKQKGSNSGSGKAKRVKSRPASDDLKSVGVKKQKGSHSGSGKAKRVKSRLGGGVKKQKGSNSGSGKAKRVKSRLAGGVKKQKGSSSRKGKKDKSSQHTKSKPAADDLKSTGAKKKKTKSSDQMQASGSSRTSSQSEMSQGSQSSAQNQKSGQSQTSYQTSYESESSGHSQNTGHSQSSGTEYTYEESHSSGQHVQQEISVSYGSLYGPQASAVAECTGQDGMELAVISEKMIQDMIADAFRNNYEGDIWIGSMSSDQQTWFDGTPVTWTWWADNKGDGECLIMSEQDDYKWKHAPCTADIAFYACMSRGPETVVSRK